MRRVSPPDVARRSPGSNWSTSVTSSPSRASHQASDAPNVPAPTITTCTAATLFAGAHRIGRVALSGKRVLITGGAGFIGSTVARRLVGENTVVAADNLHREPAGGLMEHPNFEFHRVDVMDAEAMHELAQGVTHIVHCAAIAGVDTVRESPVRTMRVNMIGTYNVLEAALATNDTLERVVEFSTSEVFGTRAINAREGNVTTIGSVGEARWTYAVSKLAGEHMAHAYYDELLVPTVTVRPFNVYGPGQIGGGAIRAFIEAALAGHDLTIHGDGSQIRAWCYVDN